MKRYRGSPFDFYRSMLALKVTNASFLLPEIRAVDEEALQLGLLLYDRHCCAELRYSRGRVVSRLVPPIITFPNFKAICIIRILTVIVVYPKIK